METITVTALQLFIIHEAVGKGHSNTTEEAERAAELWHWLEFRDDEKEAIDYRQKEDGEELFRFDAVLERSMGAMQRRLARKILEAQVGIFKTEVYDSEVRPALLALGWVPKQGEEEV